MLELFTRNDLPGAGPDVRWLGAAIARGVMGLVLGFAILAAPALDRGPRAAESELREVLVGVARSFPPQ